MSKYTPHTSADVKAMLDADLTVTARLYNGYETETGYHHYTVDLAQYYEIHEED